MRKLPLYMAFCMVFSLAACGDKHNQQALEEFSHEQLHLWNKKLTDIMIADIFTPPVCSRIYAYPNMAAYQVLRQGYTGYHSLAGQINGLKELPPPQPGQEIFYPLSAVVAFSDVAKKLVYSDDKVEAYEQEYLKQIKEKGIDEDIYQYSVDYGRLAGQHMLDWVQQDGYLQRQALPRHILSEHAGAWKPTPPDYMPGIEPHWRTIRTLVIDSAHQFAPDPPTTFDSVPGSPFYQEALEVYNMVNEVRKDAEKTEIAKFWDCNPNISYTRGHVMFFHQKISPGGHWMSIASIAGRNKDLGIMEQAETFTATSIALFDAFISCWDEKYRSDLIRPETFIDLYIEPGWEPILQTPAFPEYTSGHSVISASAASILTSLHGDNFAFTDSTEVEFGMPARKYNSFFEASNEAAISRLYGGIHYRPACFNGVEQGKQVGNYVIANLNLREEEQPVARIGQ